MALKICQGRQLPASQWVWEPRRAGRDLQHTASRRGEQSSVGLVHLGWRQRVLHWEPGRGQEAGSGLGTRSKHGEDLGSSRQRPSLVSGPCSGHPGDVLPGQHYSPLCHPSPASPWGLISPPRVARLFFQHAGSIGSAENRSLPLYPFVSWAHGGGWPRVCSTGVQHACACASTALC